jgi:hypothetical protein
MIVIINTKRIQLFCERKIRREDGIIDIPP